MSLFGLNAQTRTCANNVRASAQAHKRTSAQALFISLCSALDTPVFFNKYFYSMWDHLTVSLSCLYLRLLINPKNFHSFRCTICLFYSRYYENPHSWDHQFCSLTMDAVPLAILLLTVVSCHISAVKSDFKCDRVSVPSVLSFYARCEGKAIREFNITVARSDSMG